MAGAVRGRSVERRGGPGRSSPAPVSCPWPPPNQIDRRLRWPMASWRPGGGCAGAALPRLLSPAGIRRHEKLPPSATKGSVLRGAEHAGGRALNECLGGLDGQSPSRVARPQREVMVEPEAVTAAVAAAGAGLGCEADRASSALVGVERSGRSRLAVGSPKSDRDAATCWMGSTIGCMTGFAGTVAMPMWCARSRQPRSAALPVCGRCDGRSRLTEGVCWPKLRRRFAWRRRIVSQGVVQARRPAAVSLGAAPRLASSHAT